ncbi:MAG TPA: FxsA family protein [Acidimicrobiales bacterium]|nr:FxsA family protein [Acidimicrobiales bacterium]
MFAVLALAFLVVPFVEIYVLIQVGQAIGAPATILVLIALSVAGAWMVKREGIAVLRAAREEVRMGQLPGVPLVDGVLLLFAGALLLTPGFVTDVLGLLLLLPPVRRAVRVVSRRYLERRLTTVRIERG